MHRISVEEIKNRVESMGSEIRFDEWNGIKGKYDFRCAKCKNWFKVTFSKFQGGQRVCKKCLGITEWTLEIAKEYTVSVGSEIIDDEWFGVDHSYNFKCVDCGVYFTRRFGDFYYKKQYICPACGKITRGKKKQVPYIEVSKILSSFDVELRKNMDIEMTEDQWEGAYKTYWIQCAECKEWTYKTVNAFTQGSHRCVDCGKKHAGKSKTKSHEEFVQSVFLLEGDEYSVISRYTYGLNKIQMKHNKCGNVWEITPANFLRGRRCPYCFESKGEQAIRHWLNKENIKYTTQYIYDDLVSDKGNPLRFDFAVYDVQDELYLLIEYDGEFHYKKQYKNDGYEELIKHDHRKTQYCIDNHIPLLRIPYWEYEQIENILHNKCGVLIQNDAC